MSVTEVEGNAWIPATATVSSTGEELPSKLKTGDLIADKSERPSRVVGIVYTILIFNLNARLPLFNKCKRPHQEVILYVHFYSVRQSLCHLCSSET